MNVAIVGAGGSCGRQLAAQLLEQRILPASSRLQLVGHRGGRSEHELWGLRADLEDAFVDNAPAIEVIFSPSEIDADLVLMLAGATISTDPNTPVDRAALGHTNLQIFVECAEALANLSGPKPTVIVQSNPVELGVKVFADRLGRHLVLGAGAWSDTLRFRAEIAAELGVNRTNVNAMVLGQHGDNAIPIWSQVQVRGVSEADVEAMKKRILSGRTLADFPREVRASKAHMLELVQQGNVKEAYKLVQSLPPGLRATVKPFLLILPRVEPPKWPQLMRWWILLPR